MDAAVLHQPTREILERVREEASRVARAVPLVAEVLRNINLGRNPEEREAAQETLESHRNWERVNRLSQSRRGLSNRDWEFLQGVSRGEAKAEAATGQELATARLVVDAAIRWRNEEGITRNYERERAQVQAAGVEIINGVREAVTGGGEIDLRGLNEARRHVGEFKRAEGMSAFELNRLREKMTARHPHREQEFREVVAEVNRQREAQRTAVVTVDTVPLTDEQVGVRVQELAADSGLTEESQGAMMRKMGVRREERGGTGVWVVEKGSLGQRYLAAQEEAERYQQALENGLRAGEENPELADRVLELAYETSQRMNVARILEAQVQGLTGAMTTSQEMRTEYEVATAADDQRRRERAEQRREWVEGVTTDATARVTQATRAAQRVWGEVQAWPGRLGGGARHQAQEWVGRAAMWMVRMPGGPMLLDKLVELRTRMAGLDRADDSAAAGSTGGGGGDESV